MARFLQEITYFNLGLSLVLFALSLHVAVTVYPVLIKQRSEKFLLALKNADFWLYRVLIPLTFLELASYYLMLRVDPDTVYSEWTPLTVGEAILGFVTFIILHKIHKSLRKGRHEKLLADLMNWNWLRTILWAIKTVWLAHGIISNLKL